MISVLIVDDEPIMCRGLSNALDWEQHGFTLVGCSYNGEEALSRIHELNPDIVLTDIRMPAMSGLELAKQVNEHFRETKVIILSGYDDFNYAKEAIHYGVSEYLLKPIDNGELLKILLRLKDNIGREKETRKKEEETEQKLSFSLPALKERTLRQIIDGNITSPRELLSIAALTDLRLKKPYFAVEVFFVNSQSDMPSAECNVIHYISNITDEILKQHDSGEFWVDNTGRICVLFSFDADCYANIVSIGEDILYHIKKFLNLNVIGSISRQCHGFNGISAAYSEAVKALKYRILLDSNHLIKADDRIFKGTEPDISQLEDLLLFHIRYGDREKANQTLQSIYEIWQKSRCMPEYLEDKVRELIVLILKIIREQGVDIAGKLNFNIYNDFIYNFDSIDGIVEWMRSIVGEVTEGIINMNKRKYGGIIGKAMAYIERNYFQDITLNDLADTVYMNSNYLSQLFKQQTGKNFIEYLTEFRIEKAKELLKTPNMKAYSIAEEIGYKDQHYFSQIFKRYTGVTPSEYRKKVM